MPPARTAGWKNGNNSERLSLPSRRKRFRLNAAVHCLLACAIGMILCGVQYLHARQTEQEELRVFCVPAPLYVPVPDTATKTILLTGDSMGDGLSVELRRLGKCNRLALVYVPWYSSTSLDWGGSDTLRQLIQRHHPSLVLFSLGSNELFIPAIQKRERYIRAIVRQLQTAPYVWIGPPNWKEDTGINALIRKNVDSLHFFPSKGLPFDRMSDGAHPTFRSSARWADTLAGWITQNDAIGLQIHVIRPHAVSLSSRR